MSLIKPIAPTQFTYQLSKTQNQQLSSLSQKPDRELTDP